MTKSRRTDKKINRVIEPSFKESKKRDYSICVIENCSDYGINPIGIIMNSESCISDFVCDKHYAELLERYYFDEKRFAKQKMSDIYVR